MIGRSGKCPVKCGSFNVTHLTPTAFLPISYSTTLSTKRNGYLCGSIPLISSKLKTVLTEDVNDEISSAVRGSDGVSSSSSALICVDTRCITGAVGDRKAVAVDARIVNRASFIV